MDPIYDIAEYLMLAPLLAVAVLLGVGIAYLVARSDHPAGQPLRGRRPRLPH